MAESIDDYYMVWGVDQAAYGPVPLTALVAWVNEGRVTADSWVFSARTGTWQKGRKVPEIKALFGGAGDTTRLRGPATIEPQLLRKVKVLQSLTDNQLSLFAKLVELEEAPEGARIITKGQTDDSLYFILEGELTVCLPVMGNEEALTTLGAGDFFGDVALLSKSGRCADVIAKRPCRLAKITSSALDEIAKRDPIGSTSFLRAMDEALSERIRADNQRLASMMNSPRI